MSPYWLVGHTADKDLANMDRSTLKCTGSFTAGCEESQGDAALVPILQNTKVVKAGDELLLYDSKLGRPSLSIEPLSLQPKRKRAAPPTRLNQPHKKAMKSR